MVLQRVHINSFTETGSFTSLSFDDQDRNSAVGRIGYQVTFDAGAFRPFAKAVWNHEFVDSDRQVTAFLTTITAPGFSLPAVVVGKDWGAVSAGTTVKLSNSVTGLLAFVGTFAQDNVNNYGVQFGLNIALGQPPSADMPVKAPRM
jgi:outer membrane lipase/esterase